MGDYLHQIERECIEESIIPLSNRYLECASTVIGSGDKNCFKENLLRYQEYVSFAREKLGEGDCLTGLMENKLEAMEKSWERRHGRE